MTKHTSYITSDGYFVVESAVQSTWDQVYRTCLNDSSLIATNLHLCAVFIQGSRIRNSDYWIGHKRQFYSRTDKGKAP